MSRRKIGRKVADIWKDNGRMFGHEHATMVSTRNEDSRSGLNRAALFFEGGKHHAASPKVAVPSLRKRLTSHPGGRSGPGSRLSVLP